MAEVRLEPKSPEARAQALEDLCVLDKKVTSLTLREDIRKDNRTWSPCQRDEPAGGREVRLGSDPGQSPQRRELKQAP